VICITAQKKWVLQQPALTMAGKVDVLRVSCDKCGRDGYTALL